MADFDIQLPTVKSGSHIGILGGSFDPPHLCHQLLALSFLTLEPIDELWIIPCADHAFKDELTSFRHRFAMSEIAFKRLSAVRVLDIEKKLETPNYTIETIDAILQKRPDLKLLLCLGSDLIHSFHTWHNAALLAQKVKIALFERNTFPIASLPPLLKNAHIHRGYALPNTNSTAIRDFLARREKEEVCNFLDRDVFSYIKENRLYLKID